MSAIEITNPTNIEEPKPKKKYPRSQAQKEKYKEYNRQRYAETKEQLKNYHAKPKEERGLYYQKNKSIIIDRAKQWNKNKLLKCKEQAEEIKLLRSYLADIGENIEDPADK
jgi:hypothetical protein